MKGRGEENRGGKEGREWGGKKSEAKEGIEGREWGGKKSEAKEGKHERGSEQKNTNWRGGKKKHERLLYFLYTKNSANSFPRMSWLAVPQKLKK